MVGHQNHRQEALIFRPFVENSRWARTTFRITRMMVLRRCSMLSISQRAFRTLFDRIRGFSCPATGP